MKKVTNKYAQSLAPKGYVSNGEIDTLPDTFLVRGSQNTRIVGKRVVQSEQGYIRTTPKSSDNKGTTGGYTWKTSTGTELDLKVIDRKLYVSDNVKDYHLLKSGFRNEKPGFAEWFSTSDQLDYLLMVAGDSNIYDFSGGFARIAEVTASTITKQGYITGTNISFQSVSGGGDTITDAGGRFITYGFKEGDYVTITGSTSNNGTYLISNVTANVVTLIDGDLLVNESAGATVIFQWTRGTWAESRFHIAGTRKVVIKGKEYEYTGGETTGTLTGITPSPLADGIVNGDVAIQAIRTTTDKPAMNYRNDFIGVRKNQILIGSKASRDTYWSKTTDFKDFSFTTSGRLVGEGFKMLLDAVPTGFVNDKEYFYVSAGTDFWFRVEFKLNANDQTKETISVERVENAPLQSAINQDLIIPVSKNTMYVSQDKSIKSIPKAIEISSLDQIERPISELIKDDLAIWDLTDGQGIYFKNSLFITIPRESIVIEYSLEDDLWQPPHTWSLSRLFIFKGKLYGHSKDTNETYQLFSSYAFDDKPYKQVARFGYESYGSEFEKKNIDRIGTTMKLKPGTRVTRTLEYDYLGDQGSVTAEINTEDNRFIFGESNITGGLGHSPLGSVPLGGLEEENETLLKYRRIFLTPQKDFYERQVVYEAEGIDQVFILLTHGENVEMSKNDAFEITE